MSQYLDANQQRVVDEFHRLYYHTATTWPQNTYMGYFVQQSPFDLYLYQELIYREPPAAIVQTGVARGGSVLYFAHLLDLIGAPANAVVIGVDIVLTPEAQTLTHPRIRLVEGNSVAPQVVTQVLDLLPAADALVVLDSDHGYEHVVAELNAYCHLVRPGHHLIVEDTNINGNPVAPGWGRGPREAVDQFLARHREFERDDALWQRNLLSFHQYGWLLRRDDGGQT